MYVFVTIVLIALIDEKTDLEYGWHHYIGWAMNCVTIGMKEQACVYFILLLTVDVF